MRASRQFAIQNQEKDEQDRKKKKRRLPDDDFEDDQIKWELPKQTSLNSKDPGVFDSVMDHGINTEESIFDRQAVFRVHKEEGF